MNSLAGKTIRWTFVDDPMPEASYEHLFHEDGSVTWRIIEGQYKGATGTERPYAAVEVNDRTWAVSYLGASGHTLTVVLNLDDDRLIGFASNENSWCPLNGTFEIFE